MAINKKLGAATGVAGVGALGATTSAAATNSTVALASNLMTKLGYGTANTVGGSGSMLAAANPAVAGAVAALPLVMGLTGMPSGKANIAKLKKAKQDTEPVTPS